MKFLIDLLPIILFFVVFKVAQGQPEAAAAWASEHFGGLVSGGVVGPQEAPVLLATLVVVAATLAQVLYLIARGRKVDLMLWISLALVVVLGGATVYLHSETFIKWKPTALWGAMALVFLVSERLFHKNLIAAMLGEQLTLPAAIWRRVNDMWVGFFSAMAVLNWVVFTHFSTEAWVNFKLFGGTGLMLLFILAQGMYLSRHLPENEHKDPT